MVASTGRSAFAVATIGIALLSGLMVSAKDFIPLVNTDFPGNTITTLSGTPPAACLAACLAMPACVMYQVGSPLVSNNRCWLKLAVSSASNLYIGLTAYIPVADGIVRCSVNYDTCDGSFSTGGDCASSEGVCGNGYHYALNAVARAVTLLTAAPNLGFAAAGLSEMHLPALLNRLKVRTLIAKSVGAAVTAATCGVISRMLYSGTSISSVARCSHPDLDEQTDYFLLAGSFNGFSGCIAVDPCRALIPISVVGGTVEVFSNSSATQLDAADLPTRVLAPLDAAMFSLKGEAPMRDLLTDAVQGTATGHLTFRSGVALVQIGLDALAFSANGPASLLVNFDPADDGFGTPDHAVMLSLAGGPSVTYGPTMALETLDLTTLPGLSTSLSWTFRNSSDYAFQTVVAGTLTLETLMALSGIVNSTLASLLDGDLNVPISLAVSVTPEAWSLAIVVAGPVTLTPADPALGPTLLLAASDTITISGTRASADVEVVAIVAASLAAGLPGTVHVANLTLAALG